MQIWLPRSGKVMIKLERMQKSFTRMLLEGLRYKERLDSFELFSLEQRNLRIDLIEVYKMYVRDVDEVFCPSIGESKMREQRFKM